MFWLSAANESYNSCFSYSGGRVYGWTKTPEGLSIISRLEQTDDQKKPPKKTSLKNVAVTIYNYRNSIVP